MWVAAIPFQEFSMPKFDFTCEAIGRNGKGFKDPSKYQLQVTI